MMLLASFLLVGSLGFALKSTGKPERRGEPGAAYVRPTNKAGRGERGSEGQRRQRQARTSFDFGAAPGMIEPLAPMVVFALGTVGIDQVRQRRRRRRFQHLATSTDR
jgi:hypothetical protein